jgi:hypothetical protein
MTAYNEYTTEQLPYLTSSLTSSVADTFDSFPSGSLYCTREAGKDRRAFFGTFV